MRVAGSTLLCSRLTLAESCAKLAELGFRAVDIGMQEGWAHVDPSVAIDDPDATADRIGEICRTADLEPVALNVSAGDVGLDTERERIEAIADVAMALGIDVITLPASSTETPLAVDMDRFEAIVEAVRDRDVAVTVETHWGTHTENPAVAVEYAETVPGLGYTLDPGHFAIGPHWEDAPYTDLLRDVEHVHLRQAGAGWEEIQRPVGSGRIDIERFVRRLRDIAYDGAITVEYIDALDGVDPDDAETQATEMRKRLEELL